jgi:hypothetical protein
MNYCMAEPGDNRYLATLKPAYSKKGPVNILARGRGKSGNNILKDVSSVHWHLIVNVLD